MHTSEKLHKRIQIFPPNPDTAIQAERDRLQTLINGFRWEVVANPEIPLERLAEPANISPDWIPPSIGLEKLEQQTGRRIAGFEQWYHPETGIPIKNVVWVLVDPQEE